MNENKSNTEEQEPIPLRALIRRWLVFFTFALALVYGLAVFLGVPYVVGLLIVAGWVFFGHLISLDDEMPGEWGNPEGSKHVWHWSLFELMIKLIVFAALLLLVLSFPGLKQYGV